MGIKNHAIPKSCNKISEVYAPKAPKIFCAACELAVFNETSEEWYEKQEIRVQIPNAKNEKQPIKRNKNFIATSFKNI